MGNGNTDEIREKDGVSARSSRLIVAFDVPDRRAALDLARRLAGTVSYAKVGGQLFTAEGPEIVKDLIGLGFDVFLDLKFHDIPNTVAESVLSAARLGVAMVNVHAAGGSAMMRETMDRLRRAVETEGVVAPRVIAVTVLTSTSAETLAELGISESPVERVIRLARLAHRAGLDGVVASPQEIAEIRATVPDPEFLVVTPGVRPSWAAANDQHRIMTPAEAVSAGASHLVVGRPITAANDPAEAAARILREMNG